MINRDRLLGVATLLLLQSFATPTWAQLQNYQQQLHNQQLYQQQQQQQAAQLRYQQQLQQQQQQAAQLRNQQLLEAQQRSQQQQQLVIQPQQYYQAPVVNCGAQNQARCVQQNQDSAATYRQLQQADSNYNAAVVVNRLAGPVAGVVRKGGNFAYDMGNFIGNIPQPRPLSPTPPPLQQYNFAPPQLPYQFQQYAPTYPNYGPRPVR